VRDREVADTRVGEDLGEPRRGARHVRLHRGHDLDAVSLSQLAREAELAGELVDRRRVRMHGERQRTRLEPAGAQQVEQLQLHPGRPARKPPLQHHVALYRPAEGIVSRRIVECRVDVREVVPEHVRPRIGVADVEVRVVNEENAPSALRLDLERHAPAHPYADLDVGLHRRRRFDRRYE
jgi:hypothetical protein